MKIRVHPASAVIPLFPFLGILTWGQTGLLWLCAVLHELAHVAAYRLCGISMESVTLLPFGLCAVPKDSLRISPKQEILCAAAGPLVNLLTVSLLLALPLPAESETVRYLLYCNAALCLVNLLPILPLDGGRILYYSLAVKWDASVCEAVCRRSGAVLISLLLAPSVAALIADKNPSFVMILGYLALYTAIRRGSI